MLPHQVQFCLFFSESSCFEVWFFDHLFLCFQWVLMKALQINWILQIASPNCETKIIFLLKTQIMKIMGWMKSSVQPRVPSSQHIYVEPTYLSWFIFSNYCGGTEDSQYQEGPHCHHWNRELQWWWWWEECLVRSVVAHWTRLGAEFITDQIRRIFITGKSRGRRWKTR